MSEAANGREDQNAASVDDDVAVSACPEAVLHGRNHLRRLPRVRWKPVLASPGEERLSGFNIDGNEVAGGQQQSRFHHLALVWAARYEGLPAVHDDEIGLPAQIDLCHLLLQMTRVKPAPLPGSNEAETQLQGTGEAGQPVRLHARQIDQFVGFVGRAGHYQLTQIVAPYSDPHPLRIRIVERDQADAQLPGEVIHMHLAEHISRRPPHSTRALTYGRSGAGLHEHFEHRAQKGRVCRGRGRVGAVIVGLNKNPVPSTNGLFQPAQETDGSFSMAGRTSSAADTRATMTLP